MELAFKVDDLLILTGSTILATSASVQHMLIWGGIIQIFKCGLLEEAGTHIQAGGSKAHEYNNAQATNHRNQVHGEVGMSFGNSPRGSFLNSMHFALEN